MSKIEDVQEEVRGDLRDNPELGKSMAKWAAAGAVVAIPVPFVGPIFGALAGAAYAYVKGRNR